METKSLVLLLSSFMLLAPFATASFAQEVNSPVNIDFDKMAGELEKEIEYLDSVKYAIPGPVSHGSLELSLSPAGQEAIEELTDDAVTYAKSGKPEELNLISTDFDFDSFNVNESTSSFLDIDFKYYATRLSEGVSLNQAWKEEVVYGVKIDPSTGEIIDIINKDTDWLNSQEDSTEFVVEDGLGSGEGLSNEQMSQINQRSIIEKQTGIEPASLSYQQRMNVKNYALAWWNRRNPHYPKYSKDCTNFVSQALHNSGWSMAPGSRWNNGSWWASKVDASWTWSGAENFYKFAIHHSKRSRLHHQQETKYLREGDIVQYKDKGKAKMSHSMVVTGIDHRGILVSYHTRDTYNRELRELFTPGRQWYPHKI